MKFVNIYETRKVVSKFETNSETPVIFHVGILDPIVVSALTDDASSFEMSSKTPNDRAKVTMRMQEHRLLALRFGLKNIENAVNPSTGKPLEFETVSYSLRGRNYTIASEAIVGMIPKVVREELASIILEENTLSGDDIKN